ncbi:MAG: transketolase family protein, partial [Clostridia bacterium]|nr:transketolase family protein [Clostridia bacterium]
PIDSIFDENYKFEIGKGVVLQEGKDVAIVATGLMVERALQAAELLKAEGIEAAVINMASIKPLDKELVQKYAAKCGAVVTTEEHSVIGGLGSAVCEAVSEQGGCPVVRHGVEDCFGKSGPALKLLDLYKLNAEGIAEKAKLAISLKK